MEVIQQYIDQIVPVLMVIGIILGVYLALLWLGLVVWTYWDIRLRSDNLLAQLLAVLVALLIPLGGVLLYMAFRPHEKLSDVHARIQEREYIMQAFEERPVCPTCQRGVEPEFILCPYCHTPLKKKCPNCDRLMDLTWQVCPYCGQ